MKIQIRGRPEFLVPFTKELAEALLNLSRHHYDVACKQLSNEGGKLLEIRVRLQFWNLTEDNEMVEALTFRECDQIAKLLEMRHYILDQSTFKLLNEFSEALRMSMIQANLCSMDWNWAVEYTS